MFPMLTIASSPVADSDVAYIAFRVAFLETLERATLAAQMGETATQYGYLTEVPFLRGTAPQVQLDALLATWTRHTSPEEFEADLVDESVLYAICETSAGVIRREPDLVKRWIAKGPRLIEPTVGARLADQIQSLHLEMTNDGDFLLISQFQDIPPAEALDLKAKFDLDESACESLFDLLGRWHVSPEFAQRGAGLVTSREMGHTHVVFAQVMHKVQLPR
jgi:hypothetical protein